MAKYSTDLNNIKLSEKETYLADEIRSILAATERFYESVKMQNIYRPITLHKRKTGLEQFDNLKDIYIPYIRWVEYVGHDRVYLKWKDVAAVLDRANATADERILHIRLEMEFRRLHLELKSSIDHLKNSIQLGQDLKKLLKNQNISLKMFNHF